MKFFRKMKMGTGLMIAFLIIALIAAGVGGYGALAMGTINKNSQELFRDKGMSQGYIGYIYEELQYIRAMARDCFISDAAGIKADTDNVAKSKQKIQAYLGSLAGVAQTDSQKALQSDLSQKINAFLKMEDDVIALVATDKDAALSMLRSDSSAKIVKDAFDMADSMMATIIDDGQISLAQQSKSAGFFRHSDGRLRLRRSRIGCRLGNWGIPDDQQADHQPNADREQGLCRFL